MTDVAFADIAAASFSFYSTNKCVVYLQHLRRNNRRQVRNNWLEQLQPIYQAHTGFSE